MASPWNRTSNLKSPKTRSRKHSFCIFTEGETERLYFSDFRMSNITVKNLEGKSILHLIEKAIRYIRKSPRYSGYDHYWLAADRDDNTSMEIQNAIQKARKNNISLCFSNPCFEIWYLLHFVYRASATTPEELKNKLIPARIPGYQESTSGIYNLLRPRQQNAIRNAERLLSKEIYDHWKNNPFPYNPSTNVHELITQLNPPQHAAD